MQEEAAFPSVSAKLSYISSLRDSVSDLPLQSQHPSKGWLSKMPCISGPADILGGGRGAWTGTWAVRGPMVSAETLLFFDLCRPKNQTMAFVSWNANAQHQRSWKLSVWKAFPLSGWYVHSPDSLPHCKCWLLKSWRSASALQSPAVSDRTARPAWSQTQQTQLQQPRERTARCVCRLAYLCSFGLVSWNIRVCTTAPTGSGAEHQLPASASSQPSPKEALDESYCVFPRTQTPLSGSHPCGNQGDGLSPPCRSLGHAQVIPCPIPEAAAAAAGTGPGGRQCAQTSAAAGRCCLPRLQHWWTCILGKA